MGVVHLLKHLQTNRVELCNVFGNHPKQEFNRKNASDIELSLCALETHYKDNNIDTYVFITSDSDMIPIMNKLLFYGKKVHLYYINENRNQSILNFCNVAVDLVELMEIDIERKNYEYWIETIENIFQSYYWNEKNENKIMSHKWLLENIQRDTYMSIVSSNRLINKMLEYDIIEKSELNNYYGYKLKK